MSILSQVILAVLCSAGFSALGVLPDQSPLISTLNVEDRGNMNDIEG